MRKLSGAFAALSIAFSAHAQAPAPDKYAGKTSMNGFSLSDFPDFHLNWKLITARYREDTKEMRFVYANDIAVKALDKKMKDYPDGAVFAKFGFISEKDPLFPSSIVPSGAKRYQFMVRDKKKFASTDGWGYALFNGNGQTFNGEPRANSMACAACHRLAESKGYVFSEQVQFASFVEQVRKNKPAAAAKPAKHQVVYKTAGRETLKQAVARVVPAHFSQVRMLAGAIQKNIFEGTVNEIGPVLAAESAQAKMPAVLSNDGGDLFAVAYPEEGNPDCASGETRTIVARSVASNRAVNGSDEVVVKMLSYCFKP